MGLKSNSFRILEIISFIMNLLPNVKRRAIPDSTKRLLTDLAKGYNGNLSDVIAERSVNPIENEVLTKETFFFKFLSLIFNITPKILI